MRDAVSYDDGKGSMGIFLADVNPYFTVCREAPYTAVGVVFIQVRLLDVTLIPFKIHFVLVMEYYIHATVARPFQMRTYYRAGYGWPSLAPDLAPVDDGPAHNERYENV